MRRIFLVSLAMFSFACGAAADKTCLEEFIVHPFNNIFTQLATGGLDHQQRYYLRFSNPAALGNDGKLRDHLAAHKVQLTHLFSDDHRLDVYIEGTGRNLMLAMMDLRQKVGVEASLLEAMPFQQNAKPSPSRP